MKESECMVWLCVMEEMFCWGWGVKEGEWWGC